jgi:anti-sigma factor RsiW
MKNFREIEHLSAYLDGQLDTSELARIESRLNSDPELASILSDLRATRGILRKLPTRKAPRNFTLTRQMVGLKPPLPRTYPVFRFATVFASLLLMLSLTVNAMSPYVSFGAPSGVYGFGGGGEGGWRWMRRTMWRRGTCCC